MIKLEISRVRVDYESKDNLTPEELKADILKEIEKQLQIINKPVVATVSLIYTGSFDEQPNSLD